MTDATDYAAIARQMEAAIALGDAEHSAWRDRRASMVSILENAQRLMESGGPARVLPEFKRGYFDHASYRQAVEEVLRVSVTPLTAPEIAGVIAATGKAESRLVKVNVNSALKELKGRAIGDARRGWKLND